MGMSGTGSISQLLTTISYSFAFPNSYAGSAPADAVSDPNSNSHLNCACRRDTDLLDEFLFVWLSDCLEISQSRNFEISKSRNLSTSKSRNLAISQPRSTVHVGETPTCLMNFYLSGCLIVSKPRNLSTSKPLNLVAQCLSARHRPAWWTAICLAVWLSFIWKSSPYPSAPLALHSGWRGGYFRIR